jgi:hypothetical protein
MKLLRTTCLIVAILLATGGSGVAQTLSQDEELAVAVKDFLTVWLIDRNVTEAMTYLSKKPILGKCMTPDSLEHKRISNHDILAVFRTVLTRAMGKSDERRDLSQLVDASGALPFDDDSIVVVRHSMERYFQVFKLKSDKPGNLGYICKFDERQSFRRRVADPDVHYVITTLKNRDASAPLNFELLWIKESGHWRILTMAGLED